MFDRIKSAFRTVKESSTWPAILSLNIRGPIWMSANYEAFAREGYTWNPDVYACINRKVEAMRGLKFGVYQKKGTGLKLVSDGPLVDLLNRPNPRQSFSAIAGEWMGSKCVSGNAYIEGVSIDGRESDKIKNPPKELYCLRPDRVFVVAGNAQVPVAGFRYIAGSLEIDYPAQMWRNPKTGGFQPRLQLLHSKYWHPLDDWYGLSPIAASSRNIDASNSSIAHNVGLTQNFGRPSGVFTSPETLSVEKAEEYSNAIRQKFTGPQNAGRPMVLSNGFTWTQLGLTPVDMDWLKGLEWNTNKICAVFGVPAEMIGDGASRTYSNYEEARKSFYLETMLPEADGFCDDLNTWLTPLFSNAAGEELVISVDRDAIEAIQVDRKVKWENAVSGASFLTVNEQRELLGYDPRPEGDVIMIPSMQVPLSVSGKQRQMPGQVPKPGAQPDDEQPQPKPGKKFSVEIPKQITAPEITLDEHLSNVKQRIERLQ